MEDDLIGTRRHSKEEAKRIIAKMIIDHLSQRGYKMPAEFANFKAIHQLMLDAGMPTHSYVVLLNELCIHYRLDLVEYEVQADPAGSDAYMVKARIGQMESMATGPTKRAAQQLAAEKIYRHLRARLVDIESFNEDEVIYRAYEKAMGPTADEETLEQRRRKEEEQAEKLRKQKKKFLRSVDIDETVRLELESSGDESQDVAAADEEGAAAAADPNSLEGNSDIAVRFISRTMERLGI